MKASTQYNDFVGTTAADISDHSNLTDFLNGRGVDTERYEPIGASFTMAMLILLAVLSYALTAKIQPIMNHISSKFILKQSSLMKNFSVYLKDSMLL